MSEDDSIRVQLARMEGKQDVTNERLSNLAALHDERHAHVLGEIRRLDIADNKASERIDLLENESIERRGTIRGLSLSGKAVLIAAGAIPASVIVAALQWLTP